MPILEDLANAISGYAKNYIKCKIESLQPSSQYGAKWDVGDSGSFTVKISNTGKLDVKNVKLHLNTLGGYGKIKFSSFMGSSTDWATHLDVSFLGTLKANSPSSNVFGWFQFKAEDDTGGAAKDVIEVHVAEYDVSWDNLLYDATKHEWATMGKVQLEIFPL